MRGNDLKNIAGANVFFRLFNHLKVSGMARVRPRSVAPGSYQAPGTISSTRTKHVDILMSDFKMKAPDRELFRFWGVDNVNIDGCTVDIVNGNRRISFIQSNSVTETLEIKNTTTTHPITINIFNESSPWSNPVQTFTYDGTTDFFWQG